MRNDEVYSFRIINPICFISSKNDKKYTSFFPVSYALISSREYDLLSPQSSKILLDLIALAYRKGLVSGSEMLSKCDVSMSQVRRKCGVSIAQVFSDLNDFGYLEYSKLNKIKENQSKTKEKESSSFLEQNNEQETSTYKDTRNATSLFNARFENNEEWFSVLEDFGIKKKLDLHIGQIKATFENPKELEMFIEKVSNSQKCQEIFNSDIEQSKKEFSIRQYITVSIKRNIGAIK